METRKTRRKTRKTRRKTRKTRKTRMKTRMQTRKTMKTRKTRDTKHPQQAASCCHYVTASVDAVQPSAFVMLGSTEALRRQDAMVVCCTACKQYSTGAEVPKIL